MSASSGPSGYIRSSYQCATGLPAMGWGRHQVRLAQLLEDEEDTTLSDLARCSDMIQQIAALRLIGRDKLGEQDVIQQIDSKLPTAIDRCQTGAKHVRKHVPNATGAHLLPSEK